jgi:hypothetical protein
VGEGWGGGHGAPKPVSDGACTGWWPAGQSGEERKQFFFAKKHQKTFTGLASLYPDRPQLKQSKVFCFFFSKKKALLLDYRIHPIALCRPPTPTLPHKGGGKSCCRVPY